MYIYFKTETDVAKNLINDFFFLIVTVRGPFHRSSFKRKKKCGGTGLISEKPELLKAEFNERAEAASSSYSKNQKKFQLGCLVHEFFFTDILTILS